MNRNKQAQGETKREIKLKGKKFMNRNVTQFRHLMNNHKINQNDLTWVINLRQNNKPKNIQMTVSSPPQVYFKTTENFAQRTSSQNKVTNQFKANEYDFFILKNPGSPKNTQTQINFYSSLRRRASQNSKRSNDNDKFTTIPYVDRKTSPFFIKKEFIKKTKTLTKCQIQSALDGANKYDPYTQNILKTKNYGFLQTFAKVHGRSQVSLPTLAWQIGLRGYR